MELIACVCPVGFGIPHDHILGTGEGHELPHYDPNDIGRVWVDWRKLAREFMRADSDVLAPT